MSYEAQLITRKIELNDIKVYFNALYNILISSVDKEV